MWDTVNLELHGVLAIVSRPPALTLFLTYILIPCVVCFPPDPHSSHFPVSYQLILVLSKLYLSVI